MSIEITWPVAELKTALAGFGKVISKSTRLPVLKSIRVTRDESGTIHLQATDLDTFLTYRMDSTQSSPAGEFLMPYEPVLKIVKSSSRNSEVVLTQHTAEDVRIRYYVAGNPIEQRMETLPLQDYPPLPSAHPPTVTLDHKAKKALLEALACASDESTRLILNGACLDKNHMVGTDGKHLYAANSFCFDLPQLIIIPNHPFLSWAGFVEDGDWQLGFEPPKEKEEISSWIKIQSNHWTVVTRAIEGTYPNWKQCVPTATPAKTHLQFTEEAVKMLLEIIPKLPGKEDINQAIRLSVEGREFTVAGKDAGQDSFTQIPIPGVQITGPSITTTINRSFLLKALKFGLIEVDMVDELTPLIFRNEGKKMVVMPLRPETYSCPPKTDAPQSEPQPDHKSNPESEADTSHQEPSIPTTHEPKEKEPMQAPVNRITDPMTLPETNRLTSTDTAPGTETVSSLRQAIDHLEQIKSTLKALGGEMAEAIKLLQKAEREKRCTEKEIAAIRTSLREIQAVKI